MTLSQLDSSVVLLRSGSSMLTVYGFLTSCVPAMLLLHSLSRARRRVAVGYLLHTPVKGLGVLR
jgi:hypothetical protein